MDIQRNLLIAALVLVSVMLLTEWVKFRDAHPAVAVATSRQAPATPVSNSAQSFELPAPQSASGADLPQVGVGQSSTAAAVSAPTQDRIRVSTDTLIVEISLVGGDITSVELPRHLAELGNSSIPFQLLEQGAERSYIAQSGLIGPNGTDTSAGRPRFRSKVSDAAMLPDQNELLVDLSYETPDAVTITKRFHFTRGEYLVGVEYLIANHGSQNWQAALFGQLVRDNNPDPGANGGSLGIKPFIGFATHTTEEPYHKFTFKKIEETPYQGKTMGGWIALVQHYFISAWIPDAGQENSYEMLKSSTSQNIGRFTTPTLSVAPNTSGSFGAGFYAGPKDQYRLRDISPGLDLTVDYGWLWWIAQPLFALLYFFATGQLHIAGWEMSLGTGIGNWGVAIILLTVLVKLAFFHLSATSYKSMAKMRKLQPKMLELKERFGEDRQKLSQETMDLYRKEKVNPLGGCLPILIQMPVFLSLYWVLLESVELRHAPFMAWIHDLSVMDPYYVLPLLMGASMFFQQKLNPAPPDPIQAKVFQFMPIIFTVFFLFFPAGLVLYWLVNNVLSITQQWIITRQIERVS